MSRLGQHWIRTHPDGQDLAHVERMQYRSVKLFEWMWSDRDFCRELLSVLPQDAYILARDHPLSEQKSSLWADPVGTGGRHADEWANKVRGGRYHLPIDRTFFLGINEPDATSGDRSAIDRYTTAFLTRLQSHGLRGGAFNFSTGHPRTVDGTPNSPPDYNVFEASHQAIVHGHHIAVSHIYGTAAVPCAPGHYDRLRACPWRDVTWVIGETGIDEHVIGGGPHHGWQIALGGNAEGYARWLDALIVGVNDPRIHSWQVFTYDFSHPWAAFDIRPARQVFEIFAWQHSSAVIPGQGPAGGGDGSVYLPIAVTPPRSGYVQAAAGLNVRVRPTVTAAVVDKLPYGAPVNWDKYVDNAEGRWLQIGTDPPGTRWVSAQWIAEGQIGEPPVPVTPPTAPGNEQECWRRSYAFTRRWEGGWADNPADPGGATMKGVTLATYTRWRQSKGQPAPTKDDLRNISDAEVEQIYREWYWVPSGANKEPWPLCLVVFDSAILHGTGVVADWVKKADGRPSRFIALRLRSYTKMGHWPEFGKAWALRVADLLDEVDK